MASPFTAEIIRFRPARPMQGRGAPPRPDSARIALLPRRYVRHLDADAIARLLDGTDYGEPEVVRKQREFARSSNHRIGIACCILSALVVLYFGAELARAVWS
jgi:hypothetical protein